MAPLRHVPRSKLRKIYSLSKPRLRFNVSRSGSMPAVAMSAFAVAFTGRPRHRGASTTARPTRSRIAHHRCAARMNITPVFPARKSIPRVRLYRAARQLRTLLKTLLILAAPLLCATAFMTIIEGWHVVDALYFAVAVATTVGYVRHSIYTSALYQSLLTIRRVT